MHAMSVLRIGLADDFPDAAEKHRDDAAALLRARRWDGAAYHAGYVVECSLKAVLLVGAIANRVGGTKHVKAAAPGKIAGDAFVQATIGALRGRSFGHNIGSLRSTVIGAASSGGPITVSPHVARYVPRPLRTARVSKMFGATGRGWSEQMRYRGVGSVSRVDARAWCASAGRIFSQSISRMRLDGVL